MTGYLKLALAALALMPAGGSTGAGIQSQPVCATVLPGHTTQAGIVGVINAGSHAGAIAVRAQRLPGSHGRALPASWVHITGSPAQLQPHQAGQVRVAVTVPAGTQPGHYRTDLIALTGVSDGHFALSAGAATDLEVTVGPRVKAPACAGQGGPAAGSAVTGRKPFRVTTFELLAVPVVLGGIWLYGLLNRLQGD